MATYKTTRNDLAPPPNTLAGYAPIVEVQGVKGFADCPLKLNVTLYGAIEDGRFRFMLVGRRPEFANQQWREYARAIDARFLPDDLKIVCELNGSNAKTGAPIHGLANVYYWLAGAGGGLGEEYHGGNANRGKNEKTKKECLQIAGTCLRMRWEDARGILQEIILEDKPKEAFMSKCAPAIQSRWKSEADCLRSRLNLPSWGTAPSE